MRRPIKNAIISGLVALVLGNGACSNLNRQEKENSLHREDNYLSLVHCEEELYATAFDMDVIDSVIVTIPSGQNIKVYQRKNKEEVRYKLSRKVPLIGILPNGPYTLTVVDENDNITTTKYDSLKTMQHSLAP